MRREILPRLDGAGVATDILVRARPEAYGVAYAQLADELGRFVERRWQGPSSR